MIKDAGRSELRRINEIDWIPKVYIKNSTISSNISQYNSSRPVGGDGVIHLGEHNYNIPTSASEIIEWSKT